MSRQRRGKKLPRAMQLWLELHRAAIARADRGEDEFQIALTSKCHPHDSRRILAALRRDGYRVD